MSHGCADKNYREGNNCGFLKNFKLILVPGPWIKNKLIKLGINESKIVCVGWPKLDPLFKIKHLYKPNKNYKTILWAPTHNKGIADIGKLLTTSNSISTYPKALEIFEKVLNNNKNINIITSRHPKNKNNKSPTLDKLITCDYVIADAGSTIYEAWALGKPVIFLDWLVKKNINNIIKGSAEDYIYTNNIGYHANNIDELISLLQSELIIEKDVSEFMEEYMPSKFNGISGKIIYNELDKWYKINNE